MNTFALQCQRIARRRHRLAVLRLSLPWVASVVLGFALGWISCLLFLNETLK